MILSPPVEREHLHSRNVEFRGFRRADGFWDIEGRMTDAKTYGFPNHDRGRIEAGEPVHDMFVRLTIDDDFCLRDIEVVTAAGPATACPEATANYRRLIGERVGSGWRRTLRAKVGGVEGCTHITELLTAMATVAYQTLGPTLRKRGQVSQRDGKPRMIDSCHAFRRGGALVRRMWPEHAAESAE
jgi:hypothetical protein